jgi:hypothetical protein
MYFDHYKDYADVNLNPKLLREYDLTHFDYHHMQNGVVQRVIERGWPNDWYFMLNFYGINGVKKAIKEIAYLNDKDMNFVSLQFNIPLIEMKCYTKKQLINPH